MSHKEHSLLLEKCSNFGYTKRGNKKSYLQSLNPEITSINIFVWFSLFVFGDLSLCMCDMYEYKYKYTCIHTHILMYLFLVKIDSFEARF